MQEELYTGLEIAVVGMAGRFPQADTPEAFWDNLVNGRESIEFLSDEEISQLGLDEAITSNDNFVSAGTRINHMEMFDVAFFGFSPREAATMDPQQKVFLECAWEAIESAGYDVQRCNRNMGVFAGENMNTYILHILRNRSDFFAEVDDVQAEIGNDKDYLATRVSYKLGLEGPAMTIQSACSTSLVAIHTACRSLLAGECDTALAGGVCVRVPQIKGYMYQEDGMFSKDGHCRPFDQAAQGTVFGNGAGVVLLKRLDDAMRDGDYIRAVIKGSAINNDGMNKVGYTAPSVDGQINVIKSTQIFAEVHPRSIGYIEAHGTGTKLGDPIEVSALTEVFREKTQDKQFCVLGSVKSNIGHLGAASGVMGLMKTIMALENKMIPPTLHFSTPNSELRLSESPFYINTSLIKWETGEGQLRRAGVSSFGVGGTNAHLILEEYPDAMESLPDSDTECLIVLSAKDQQALKEYKSKLKQKIQETPGIRLYDIGYTLSSGRSMFDCRFACTAGSLAELSEKLDEATDPVRRIGSTGHTKIAFMFPGQGAQHVNMGCDLYHHDAVYRNYMDMCLALLKDDTGQDFKQILFAGDTPEANRKLQLTEYTQPLLFSVEYALACTLMEQGIEPDVMVGHSLGEYVAATIAGTMDLKTVIHLVVQRSRMMQDMPAGMMISVLQPAEIVRGTLPEGLTIAADNMINACVVSGPFDLLEIYMQQMDQYGWSYKTLNTSHAFHSSMMEPAAKKLHEILKEYHMNPPAKRYLSNLYSTEMKSASSADYWVDHMLHTVRFRESAVSLLEDDYVYVEIGPGKTLINMVQSIARSIGQEVETVQCLEIPNTAKPQKTILAILGALWTKGVMLDWDRLYDKEKHRRISLPTYPFQRKKYWMDVVVTKPEEKGKARDVHKFMYLPYWAPVNDTKQTENHAPEIERVALVFYTDDTQRTLLDKLPFQGKRIMAKLSDTAWKKQDAMQYQILIRKQEEYIQLFNAIQEDSLNITDIFYAAGLFENTWDILKEDQRSTFYTVYYHALTSVAKAVKRSKITSDIRIHVLTNNAFYVIEGQKVCHYEKSIIRGACIVGQQEYTNLSFRLIDIETSDDIAEVTLEEQLSAKEPILAIRGGQKYRLAYKRRENTVVAPGNVLRKDGIYLITGGYGGIALSLANYMIHQAKCTLVMVGRRDLCPRDQWDTWLQDHEQHPDYEVIKSMYELEKLGSTVEYLTADVSDVKQMKMLVETIRTRYGAVNGIIHCAGVFGSGEIEHADPSAVEKVLDTKIVSAKILGDYSVEAKPDFFFLCSSLSAVLGGIGNADYCAANQYYDQMAQYLTGTKQLQVKSVNWDEWQEVGMAERLKRTREKQAAEKAAHKEG